MEIYKGIGTDHCEHEDLIDFLNYVFGMNGTKSGFYRLLPKLYRPQYRPEDFNFIATENGKLRAAVGAYPIHMQVMGESLSAVGIGNVAVHPFSRGKGYMKDCMKLAMDDAVAQGMDFAVLGGRRQRYSYFGFEPAGVSGKFLLDDANLRHSFGSAKAPEGYVVKQLAQQDTEALNAIDALVRTRLSHPVRPEDKLFDVLCNWESRVCAVYAPEGSFAGYFLADHGSSVREIDCVDPAQIRNVVLACYEFMAKEEIWITVPEHVREMYDFFSDLCEVCQRVHTENYNVFHYEKVLRACLKLRAAQEQLCDGSVTVEIDGYAGKEKLRIEVKDGAPKVSAVDGECELHLTHRQAMSAFFGLMPVERRSLSAAVRSWFPLQLYVPEVDND